MDAPPEREHEKKRAALRQALIEGEESGEAMPFAIADVLKDARKEAGVRRADS